MRIDDCARLFLCARCFVQVRLCRRCDCGQRYCTPDCSSLARDTAQREAAGRYQRSRSGRMVHAEASRTHEPDPSAAKAVARCTGPTCQRCGAALAPWVRQGFLRRQVRVRAACHDHSP